MPAITKCFVKGSPGIFVPVELEFLYGSLNEGRRTTTWVHRKQWREITAMMKEAAEDAVRAESYPNPQLTRILSRPRTAFGYNLELNLRYLDIYGKDVKFWSDDEDDDAGVGESQQVSKYCIVACAKLRTGSEEEDKKAVASCLEVSEDTFADQVFCPLHVSSTSRVSSRRKHGNNEVHTEGVSKEARRKDVLTPSVSKPNNGDNQPSSGEAPRSNDDDLNWNSMPKESYYEERDDVPNNEEDYGLAGFAHDPLGGDFIRDQYMAEDDEELPDIDYTPMVIPTSSPAREVSKVPRKRTISGAGHSSRKRKEKPNKRKSHIFISKVELLAGSRGNRGKENCLHASSDKSITAPGPSGPLSLTPTSSNPTTKSSSGSTIRNRIDKIRSEKKNKKKKSSKAVDPYSKSSPAAAKTKATAKNNSSNALPTEKSTENGSLNSSPAQLGRSLRTAAERKAYADSIQSGAVLCQNASTCPELGLPDPEMPVLFPEILSSPEKLNNSRCPTPPVPLLSPEGESMRQSLNAEVSLNATPVTPGVTSPNQESSPEVRCSSTSLTNLTASTSSADNPSSPKKKLKKKNNLKSSFKQSGDKRKKKNRRLSVDEIRPPIRKVKKTTKKRGFDDPLAPAPLATAPASTVTSFSSPVQNSISNVQASISNEDNITVPTTSPQQEVAITVSIIAAPTSNTEPSDELNHSENHVVENSNPCNVCFVIHSTPTQPTESLEEGNVCIKCSSSAFLSIQQNYASDEEGERSAMEFSVEAVQKNDYASSSIPDLDPGELDRLDLNLCDFDHVYSESELHLLDPGDALGDPSHLAKYLNFDGSDDDQVFSSHRHSTEAGETPDLGRNSRSQRSSRGGSPSTSLHFFRSESPETISVRNCPVLQSTVQTNLEENRSFVRTDNNVRTPSPPHPSTSRDSTPTRFESIERIEAIETDWEPLAKKAKNSEAPKKKSVARNFEPPLSKKVNKSSEPVRKEVMKNSVDVAVSKVAGQRLRRSPLLKSEKQNDPSRTRAASKKFTEPSIKRRSLHKSDDDERSESAFSATSSRCSKSSIQSPQIRERLRMYIKKIEEIDENHIKLCLKFITEQALRRAIRDPSSSDRAKLWEKLKRDHREEHLERLKRLCVLWPFSESQKKFMINELKIKLQDEYAKHGEDFIKYVAFPEAAIRVYALCCDKSFGNCEFEMLEKLREGVRKS